MSKLRGRRHSDDTTSRVFGEPTLTKITTRAHVSPKAYKKYDISLKCSKCDYETKINTNVARNIRHKIRKLENWVCKKCKANSVSETTKAILAVEARKAAMRKKK